MGLDRDNLREGLKRKGLTPRALSLAVGDNPYLVRDILSGKSRNPRADTVAKLAEELGLPVQGLMTESGVSEEQSTFRHEPLVTRLPLLGPIQAGAWLEVDESSQVHPEKIAALLDKRYPHARQWLRRVSGDSMNLRGIDDGNLVHIVDFVDAGIRLVSGQIVEVSRYRAGGSLREVTLKEVEITGDRTLLWPRSSNPAWREPLDLGDGTDQDIEVQVTGLLLMTIKIHGA